MLQRACYWMLEVLVDFSTCQQYISLWLGWYVVQYPRAAPTHVHLVLKRYTGYQ